MNTFKKLPKKKVFRDPIYGYIEVIYEVILKLIDSKEVQRLRRIRQLSGVSMVFQTAEHSRFTHSLGAYQLANLVIKNVNGIDTLSEYEKMIFLISALLHDIGHGPYSHAFETVLSVRHEEMTARIIENNSTEINKILLEYEIKPKDIADIIRHKSDFKVVEKLLSSELDVDRMDYLVRDAYFTGVSYGNIDRNRILESLIIKDNNIYVLAKSVHTIENYLMSRYHMYFQVYYHPASRAYELLLEKIYLRIKDLISQEKDLDVNICEFVNVLIDDRNVLDYIEIDDAYVNGFVKQLTKSKDDVLNKLSNAFMNRKLFKHIELNKYETIDIDLNKYKDNKYYYDESSVSAVAYLGDENSNILMLLPNGEVINLEELSPIIESLKQTSYKKINRIFYFEEK